VYYYAPFKAAAGGQIVGLSKQDVENVAHLARLELDGQELDDYQSKLSQIVGLVDQLQGVNTEGVVPMAHPLEMSQRLRADEVTEENQRELAQQNAEAVEEGLYTVPRVIE
jgi:aspartyl-tRNA(Asn)/glutamyl-tRNA(Gln) amidotransferase subunit C